MQMIHFADSLKLINIWFSLQILRKILRLRKAYIVGVLAKKSYLTIVKTLIHGLKRYMSWLE